VKVLIAEDDRAEMALYRIAFESKGHQVILTYDGLECVSMYKDALKMLAQSGKEASRYDPFDAVILDYRMPIIDGLEAAKEIFRLNKDQRIIFASAYVKQTLMDAVKHLEQIVELIQKPFEPKVLVELVEDTSTTKDLYEINRLISKLDHSKPTGEQIDELLDILKRVQKIGLC
jgi:CheY-like chemotaxis protein